MFMPFFMPPGGQKKKILEHLILEALSEKPMYGYEIRKYIKEKTGGHWKPSFSMIYTTLKEFLDTGLVTKRQELIGGRLRNIYSLTEKGEEIVISRKKRFITFVMSLIRFIDEDFSCLFFLTKPGKLLLSDLTEDKRKEVLKKLKEVIERLNNELQELAESEQLVL